MLLISMWSYWWVGGWMDKCVEGWIFQRTSNSWNEESSLYPLWKGRERKIYSLFYPVGLPCEAWQPSKERVSTRNADRLLTEEQEMKRTGEETRKFHVLLCMLFFFFKLYKIVLVLPNIEMNPPQVYMCSPSWTILPPPSPYHPSGSSQCTSPKHPVSCIEPGLATRFIHDIIHVSMPFSQIFPPSPFPTESIRLFCTLVSLLLSRTQGYCYHLSKFHISLRIFYLSYNK